MKVMLFDNFSQYSGKRLIALLLLILPAGCALNAGKEREVPSASDFFVGHPAPDFKLKDLDGREVQLSSLKGEIVLLDFWATWCGYCRQEIPTIEHISKDFEKKHIVVIGVNSGEEKDIVKSFVAKNKMTYPVVLTAENPEVISNYGARALPTVAVIDKNGIIAAYRVGEGRDTEEILRNDIHRVSSSKYAAPEPKPVQMAQTPQASATPVGPDPSWQPRTVDEFLARGYARLMVRQYPQARADAEDALTLSVDSVMARFLHGRAAYDAKDYSIAIEDFDKVIQRRPDWAQGYHYRGLSYSYSGQHQRAVPDYQRTIELEPYLATGYNDLGWAYRELGEFDKAKANFDKAIELEPNYIRARENRAILFDKQNNFEAELNEITMIRRLVPNYPWAKDTEQAVLQKLGATKRRQEAKLHRR